MGWLMFESCYTEQRVHDPSNADPHLESETTAQPVEDQALSVKVTG